MSDELLKYARGALDHMIWEVRKRSPVTLSDEDVLAALGLQRIARGPVSGGEGETKT